VSFPSIEANKFGEAAEVTGGPSTGNASVIPDKGFRMVRVFTVIRPNTTFIMALEQTSSACLHSLMRCTEKVFQGIALGRDNERDLTAEKNEGDI
jgi:hypothetical protein